MNRSLRVLMVEDSDDDAELVCNLLRRDGLEVTSGRVATDAALREALDGDPWDIVLADYSLPLFSGKLALAAVRERGLDIPFIIVSGSLGEDVAVEMMRAGAHDFFAKHNLTRLAVAIEREVHAAELRGQRAAQLRQEEEERARLIRELREAVHARDTFMTVAAHELRSPLTAAQLKIDLLLRSERAPAKPSTAEALEQNLMFIARQHWKLAALVDNFLAVSVTPSSGRSLGRGSVDLSEEVAEAVRQLDEDIRTSGSAVSIRSDLPVVGHWDRSRIRTAARNLVSNAVKYGASKPIDIVIAREGDSAQLTVTDHGAGISPEAQARIFNQFEYAVPQHHHGGFGLGLWVVRRVAEAHQGTITVSSRPGHGSTFTLRMPIHSPR